MKIKTTRSVSQEIITNVLCDICDSSLLSSIGNIEGLSYWMSGGYGSLLGDGIEYEFDVCESCLLKWFKTFKRDPKMQKPEPEDF